MDTSEKEAFLGMSEIECTGAIQQGVKIYLSMYINRGISCYCWECFSPFSHL